MHSSISADGDMGATDVAGSNRAARMAVHFYGRSESGSAISRANIVEIAMGRFASEIHHVQDALAVDRNLRLDSAVRYSNGVHGRPVVFAGWQSDWQDQDTESGKPSEMAHHGSNVSKLKMLNVGT
jgi:hypothetical protein